MYSNILFCLLPYLLTHAKPDYRCIYSQCYAAKLNRGGRESVGGVVTNKSSRIKV